MAACERSGGAGWCHAGEQSLTVQGKTKGDWAREGSLPRREGPGMRRHGRAVVPGRIRGSTAELLAQQGGGVWWTAVQCLPGRPARRERRASALQGERAGQGGEARRWRRVWRAHRAQAEFHSEDDDGLGFVGNWSGDRV